MTRTMLRSKIHRIAVTACDVDYEGSLTLDAAICALADMLPYERIEVYDIDNGARFATYLLEGPADSGVCCVNGAAARLVRPGDLIILCTYGDVTDDQGRNVRPIVVQIGEDNSVTSARPQANGSSER